MPLGITRLTELTYRFQRLDGKWSDDYAKIFERGLAGAPYYPTIRSSTASYSSIPTGRTSVTLRDGRWNRSPVFAKWRSPQATVEREAMVEAGCRFDALEDICVYNVVLGV